MKTQTRQLEEEEKWKRNNPKECGEAVFIAGTSASDWSKNEGSVGRKSHTCRRIVVVYARRVGADARTAHARPRAQPIGNGDQGGVHQYHARPQFQCFVKVSMESTSNGQKQLIPNVNTGGQFPLP